MRPEALDGRLSSAFPELIGWCPPGVAARVSTRHPGFSHGPWAGLNLGNHVGDDPAAVHRNRLAFSQVLEGARPVWLNQIHGVDIVDAAEVVAERGFANSPPADACWTGRPGLACVVLVADCLPVLFTHRQGGIVAAAHAGWRGLAAGVLIQTVQTLCRATACEPSDLKAWIGPAIGPEHFEVGHEVVAAFAGGPHFRAKSPGADGQPRWWADLPGLAQTQLKSLGLVDVLLSGRCTFRESADFYSYRRDGQTGRQAAAIWLR
jgi:polyphenol oxidase